MTSLRSPCGPPSAVCLAALGSVEKSDAAEEKGFTPNQTFVYDEAGNCPSLRSRPAKWLRIDDTALAVEQLLHDATRKLTQAPPSEPSGYAQRGALSVSRLTSVARLTCDADIHLMSVTTQGSPQSSPHSPSEELGTAGAAGRGATGSVASRQASGLPHIAPHNALDEAPSKTTTTRFLYDALHRRLGRVKDNGEVTVFVYEGWNVIAEKTQPKAAPLNTENLNLETRYTWGEDLSGTLQGAGGIGGLLRATIVEASINGTRSRAERDSQSQAAHEGGERRGAARSNTEHEHTFSYDSNGNVILLTDTQGRESARYAYDAFGKTLTANGPAAQMNRYRFSTKSVEEWSGLVYYGYRYYDPVTGRWPSRDPIEEVGGVNLYGAASNRLVNQVDVYGLSPGSLPPLQSGWCRFWLDCVLDPSLATPASTGGSAGPIANCGKNACWFRCSMVGSDCNSTNPGNSSAGGVVVGGMSYLGCFWNTAGAPTSCPGTKVIYFGFHESTPPDLAHNCYNSP